MTPAWGGYVVIPSLSPNLILESDLHVRGTAVWYKKDLSHFPSLQSALLTALKARLTESKRSSKESQPNPLFSHHTPRVFHTPSASQSCKKKAVCPKRSLDRMNLSSLQPTSCLAVIAQIPSQEPPVTDPPVEPLVQRSQALLHTWTCFGSWLSTPPWKKLCCRGTFRMYSSFEHLSTTGKAGQVGWLQKILLSSYRKLSQV